ncbi:MAG: ribonuclease E/G, partial [Pontixanthobacter sp.]
VSTIEEGHVEGGDDDDDDSDDEEETESEDNHDRGNRGHGRNRGGRTGKGGRRQGGGKGNSSRAKAVDEVRAKRMALRRRYKIQDVIQRRQVLLVQVVKEERGNKGAALTTYLSLAGRYTVLMPNSSHGGGISRKISSSQDRKRLKQIVGDLTLPKSMGLIVRTAGLSRTKTEIKRDFDYLARLWDDIRGNTLGSSAPALIHSDSDLIKRAIRDIYNRDIEEVIVEGEEGFKLAKGFMKMLMPSHARRVKAYSDPVPLFQRYGAEDQLRAMYDPVVQLKSGGYLVINPTEALVSIDINSGRSTKEHGIEQTATATNIEAAKEIARQLRLRDMAGLVVIDFIDMEYNSNIRKVEKAMKDSLKNDRARIQVGRISGFGLMEMSRQRLRTGVLEATTRECPHCDGTGLVRTASSAGLSALRLIEDEAAKGKGTIISLSASTEAAIYLLNAKRVDLREIEERYHVLVEVLPEGEDEGAKMEVRSSGPRPTEMPRFEPIVDDDIDDVEVEEDEDDEREERNERDEDRSSKKRRRRGGRGRKPRDDDGSSDDGRDSENTSGQNRDDTSDADIADSSEDHGNGPSEELDEDGKPRKKRRRRGGRGRRGGRNRTDGENRENADNPDGPTENAGEPVDAPAAAVEEEAANVHADDAVETAPKPKAKRAPRKKAVPKGDKPADAEPEAVAEEKPKPRARRKKAEPNAAAEEAATAEPEAEEKPKAKRKPRKKAETAVAEETAPEPAPAAKAKAAKPAPEVATDGKPRRGWWQRTFGE